MNPVRSFTKNDIPQVVKLFQKVFFNNGQAAPSSSKLDAYFEEMFFHNPWTEEGTEEEISSLGYETSDGDITGFIGISPRRNTHAFYGRSVQSCDAGRGAALKDLLFGPARPNAD